MGSVDRRRAAATTTASSILRSSSSPAAGAPPACSGVGRSLARCRLVCAVLSSFRRSFVVGSFDKEAEAAVEAAEAAEKLAERQTRQRPRRRRHRSPKRSAREPLLARVSGSLSPPPAATRPSPHGRRAPLAASSRHRVVVATRGVVQVRQLPDAVRGERVGRARVELRHEPRGESTQRAARGAHTAAAAAAAVTPPPPSRRRRVAALRAARAGGRSHARARRSPRRRWSTQGRAARGVVASSPPVVAVVARRYRSRPPCRSLSTARCGVPV